MRTCYTNQTNLLHSISVYEYICARFGVKPNPGSTSMIDSPVLPEEYAYPNHDDLPIDAHLLFEILDVGDNFCISLMQMNKKNKYMDCFCQVLDEEKIPYKIHGVYKNHLPISELKSAPICDK